MIDQINQVNDLAHDMIRFPKIAMPHLVYNPIWVWEPPNIEYIHYYWYCILHLVRFPWASIELFYISRCIFLMQTQCKKVL
jgi:hypothetical protein